MAVNMNELVDDLQAETDALASLLRPLDAAGWDTPTPAAPWTVRDQITHLAYFDEAVVVAATDPDRFRAERSEALDVDDFTQRIAEQHRSDPGPSVLAWLLDSRQAMIDAFAALDPSARVPWYGPDMSLASSLTARIMETWAHGQDVYDALATPHPQTSALRQVAHIGVRTFPNSYLARGLEVPQVEVRVELAAPDGAPWAWGPEGAADVVRGPALDFCLVATQRRHVDDTALVIEGPVATQWMSIAQTFAGPPGVGRQPGQFAAGAR